MASLSWQAFATTSYTSLPGLYELDLTVGRTNRVDPYGADTGTLRFRNIGSWSYQPKIGDLISIFADSDYAYPTFGGFVRDISYQYGIISNEDEAQIDVEGVISLLGRKTLTSFTTTATKSLNQVDQVCDEVGITTYNDAGKSTVQTQTYSGNALDLVNTLIATEAGFMNEVFDDINNECTLFLTDRRSFPTPVGATYNGTKPAQFADTPSADINYLAYNAITFKSAADNYYTQVTVEPQGLTTQVASKGAKPYRGYAITTLDATTAQADDLAEYLVSMFSSKISYPTSITLQYEGQPTTRKQALFRDLISTGNMAVIRGQIVFRGTTYNVNVEGSNLHADLSSGTTLTMHFSSTEMMQFLELDDTLYGTLDANKLGF